MILCINKAGSECANGKRRVMLNVSSLPSGPFLWPVPRQHSQASRYRLHTDFLFVFLFFSKSRLWGSETVPSRSSVAPPLPLHTGSSIRILLLPRPRRDLVVNPQSQSPVYHPPTQVLPCRRGHICSRLVSLLLVAHRL